MTFSPTRKQTARTLALLVTVALAGHASAQTSAGATTAAGADPKAQSQQEREACLSGKSGQDQAACLREIGAARQAAKQGQLDSGQGQIERNKTDRCKTLTGADQADCHARMRGEGSVEGSVKGGGVIREKRTVIPAVTTGGTAPTGSGTTGSTPASSTNGASTTPAAPGASR